MSPVFALRSLIEGLEARGDRPALISLRGDELQVQSGADLAARARRLAQGLLDAGLSPGEPVAIFAPNGPDWVVTRLGIAIAGGLAAPIDDLAGEREALGILRDSGARIAFATAAHAATLAKLDEPIEIHVLDADAEEPSSWQRLFADREAPLPDPSPDTATTLFYTSGTTGKPKSFTLSYRNIGANVDAILAENLVGADDRVLMPLPLHHAYPFVVGLVTPLMAGATVVFPESVTGPHLVRALKEAQATVMIGVPRLYTALLSGIEGRVASRGALAATMFRALLGLSRNARKLGIRLGPALFGSLHRQFGPSLRLLISGGARLNPNEMLQLEALGWEVLSGYGLAETASIFTGNRPGQKRFGSEGRPLGDGQIRIAKVEGDGAEGGEIQLKGTSVFSGYRNNDEANAEAFTEDGWFRTGDLGHLDDDGYLYVTGRAKELIVLGGGKNVFPEEIEKVYAESPYIQEIAVLERQGALVALIRPEMTEIQKGGNLNVADVIRVAVAEQSQKLPSFERLAGFAIAREPLPRTRLGKYQRFLLPDLYEAALAGRDRPKPAEISAEDRALLDSPPAAEVWRIMERRYAERGLSLDASPQLDLGIDSLEWMTLSLEIDERLGVGLSEEELASVTTVRELLIAVGKAAEAGERRELPPAGEPTPEQARWLESGNGLQNVVALCLYGINWLMMRLLFRVELRGAEHLPDRGPYMIAANHVSDADPTVLAAALPLRIMRQVRWGGNAARLHAGPVRRFFARALHIFPVDERSPSSVITLGSAVLRRGYILIWFPESWRSPDGKLQRFLPGVGGILANTDAPVIPAYIDGTFEAMPRYRRLPRPHKVIVHLGPAAHPGELAETGEGETEAARIASALRERVARLVPR